MADEQPTIRGSLNLQPVDAIRAFEARDELAISVSWRDMQPEEHARAFTVAKIAKLDLLTTVRESLNEALREGQTFEMWQKGIQPELEKAGWWGMVQDRSLTGTDEPVFVGEKRLRTIFRTNMRVSHAAGQWARIQSAKERRPYLRYSAVMDRRTRPQHRLWHGIVLPVDHPFWRTHFPPNGWNCRCQVQQLSERELEVYGYKVTTEAELARIVSMEPVRNAHIGPRGPDGQRPRRDVLRGVDPGWDYNVGEESLLGIVEKAALTIARARAAGLDDVAAAVLADIAKLLPDEFVELLAQLLGGIAPGHEQWADNIIPAARRQRGKKGAAGIKGRSYAHGGRPDQKRDGGGRFANEGETPMGERGYRRLAHGDPQRLTAVGEMPEKTRLSLRAKTRTMYLSGASAAKQLDRHPDVKASDYQLATKIAHAGEWRIDDGNYVATYMDEAGSRWHMVVKVTKDGTPFLLSLRNSTFAYHQRFLVRSTKL